MRRVQGKEADEDGMSEACDGCGEPHEATPCEFCGFPNDPKGTAQIGWRNFGNPFKPKALGRLEFTDATMEMLEETASPPRVDPEATTLRPPPPADKRCGTCAHWDLDDPRAVEEREQVPDPQPYGVCNAEDEPNSLIVARSDGTVYGTWIGTQETFSCPLWSPK